MMNQTHIITTEDWVSLEFDTHTHVGKQRSYLFPMSHVKEDCIVYR